MLAVIEASESGESVPVTVVLLSPEVPWVLEVGFP